MTYELMLCFSMPMPDVKLCLDSDLTDCSSCAARRS